MTRVAMSGILDVFLEVAAVGQHAAHAEGHFKKGQPHGHHDDGSVNPFPLGHEQKAQAFGGPRQGQAADADPHQQQEKDRHQDTRHFFDTGRGTAHDDAPRQQQDEPLPEQGHRPIIQQRGKTGLGHGRIRGRDGRPWRI